MRDAKNLQTILDSTYVISDRETFIFIKFYDVTIDALKAAEQLR